MLRYYKSVGYTISERSEMGLKDLAWTELQVIDREPEAVMRALRG